MMVFSKDWFEKYQRPLLRFVNTRWGRYVLRIHGTRSAVDRRRITRIEPHAITWQNDDATVSTEFRTHAKYAKRLYHAFKPLWWLMHAWDMAVANRLHESLNLGFDTLTQFPDVGHSATTVDGYAGHGYADGIGESWATISGAPGLIAYDTPPSLYATTFCGSSTPDRFIDLTRALLTFDTSGIASDDTVTAAELSLYDTGAWADVGETPLHIVDAFPNQNHVLAPADYQRLGTTSFASKDWADHVADSYAAYTLNAAGRANVEKGGISGFGARLGWDLDGSFGGAWQAGYGTGYSFAAADMPGTSWDPTLVVTYTPKRVGGVHGSLSFGGSVSAKTTHYASISGSLRLGAVLNVTKTLEPVAGKEYVYRVYRADGTYLGVWSDEVASLPDWSQRLNTPGTTTTIRLARSANRTQEVREVLTDESGDPLTTEDGEDMIVAFQTNATVGEDTDLDLNHRVDIYVHYGGFEDLVTEDGEPITTEDGETLLLPLGAPLGRRVFSGFILDYEAVYGDREYIDVTLASHGFELAHEIIKNGSDTTRSYSSQAPEDILKSILDTNPGEMGYSSDSVDVTGVTISPKFRLNSKLEGIQSVYNQTDDGWYWFGHVGENLVYLKERATEPHHTFIFSKHIQRLAIRRSMEHLRNVVYFVGGDTGSAILFKKYQDAPSIAAWRQGLHRITDRRYTIAASAQRRAEKEMARYKAPIYTTEVTISSGVYDIEEIALGQVVAFANFGNFVDELLLQIVAMRYTPYAVTLTLGELLDRQQDIIADLGEDIQGEQYIEIPDAPA